MKNHKTDRANLLRWYPRQWQERYGDEFTILLEDTLQGKRPTVKFRLTIALAGLRERGHYAGVIGNSAPPSDCAKAGSLVVLTAWTAFLFAGFCFSKLSEHFGVAIPESSHTFIVATYDLIAILAILSALIVLTGATLALPSLVGFLRCGGWEIIKIHIARAIVASAILIGTTITLSMWAHQLSQYQRNGGDRLYSLAFLSWLLIFAIVLAAWSRTVVTTAQHMSLTQRAIRLEGFLAQSVTALIAAATVAIAIWWVAIGTTAPWFFQGKTPGTQVFPLDPQMVITMVLLITSTIVSGYGSLRTKRFSSELTTA